MVLDLVDFELKYKKLKIYVIVGIEIEINSTRKQNSMFLC